MFFAIDLTITYYYLLTTYYVVEENLVDCHIC